ncbi:hypothetical protein LCGC14_1601020 [marine sediment metagenome]|uniref:Uncharacterized protein n=1 Tax=marine sediment metagenome TaxID=412755 RepID=A0A0F9IB56_9ZZZZ
MLGRKKVTRRRKEFPLRIGSIYRDPTHGVIYIINGYFLDPDDQRVSNHWTARKVRKNGTLGVEVSFYGGPMVCLDRKYDIVTLCKPKKKEKK